MLKRILNFLNREERRDITLFDFFKYHTDWCDTTEIVPVTNDDVLSEVTIGRVINE